MHRISCSLALLTALVLTTSVAMAAPHAAKHVRTAHLRSHAAAACADPSGCKGGCPLGTSSAAAHAVTARSGAAKFGACPVSDPSSCPASCRRDGATAVASNTPAR